MAAARTARPNFGRCVPLEGLDGAEDEPNSPTRSVPESRGRGAAATPKERSMIKTDFRPAVLAALALAAGLAVSPAFAQTGFLVPPGAQVEAGLTAVEAGPTAVPPNAFGHFTCGYNELHTRLERETCGGTHYRPDF